MPMKQLVRVEQNLHPEFRKRGFQAFEALLQGESGRGGSQRILDNIELIL
jgi:hypothetical protein